MSSDSSKPKRVKKLAGRTKTQAGLSVQQGIAWGPLVAIIGTIATYFVSGVIGQLYIWLYTSKFHHWSGNQANQWFNNSVAGQFIYTLIVYSTWFAMIWGLLKRLKSSFMAIGWKKPKWSDAAYALIGFAIYFVVYIVVVVIISKVDHSFNSQQQQDVGFSGAGHGLGLIPVFISLVILPPIVEETVFRGFLYSGLKKTLPIIWAALITSVLFAAPHLLESSSGGLLWVAGVDTFILSFVLIFLREKTGRLWSSFGLHLLKNGVAFASLFFFAHTLH